MDFDILAFLCTTGCCLISFIIAGKSGSHEDKEWFKTLNHPDNAFLEKIMPVVGIVFYLLFGWVLYHFFTGNHVVPVLVAITIILIMGLSPYFLYKTKNLKSFFCANFILFILLPTLVFFLLQSSLTLAILVILYVLWLIYEMTYYYRLMKLNK